MRTLTRDPSSSAWWNNWKGFRKKAVIFKWDYKRYMYFNWRKKERGIF